MVPTQHPLFESLGTGGRYWRHGPVCEFSLTPCDSGKPFADVGEMTVPIMLELGYSPADINRLSETNVIRAPSGLEDLIRTPS
jgi:hypothetical protein